MTSHSVTEGLRRVYNRIRKAEAAAGRVPGSVHLLAVSKTHGCDKIRLAWGAGQRAFGENYLQEALAKQDELATLAIEWHYIGRIQSNKTRPLAERFAWVHSLSDPRHAQRLSERRPHTLPPLNVCIQVNTSGETSKGGVEPEQLGDLVEAVQGLPRLRLCGLMTIPAAAGDAAARRDPLRRLRLLRDSMANPDLPLNTLSMGMSMDLEEAISEGAGIVRIGTAIFGQRNYVEH